MAPAGCAPAYTAAEEAASRVSPTPVEALGREVDQGRGRGRRTFAPKRCPRCRATHPKPAPPPESRTHRGARGEAPSPPNGAHRHAARRFGRTHRAPFHRVFVGIHDLHLLLDPRPPPGTRADRSAPKRGSHLASAPADLTVRRSIGSLSRFTICTVCSTPGPRLAPAPTAPLRSEAPARRPLRPTPPHHHRVKCPVAGSA